MEKKINILVVFLILSLNLQAKNNYTMNHQNMKKHHEFFENLTPEQRGEVMDLRAEYMHKESYLNHEMRRVRIDLNSCMTEEEIDVDEYRQLRGRAQELKELRKQLWMEHRNKMFDIAD